MLVKERFRGWLPLMLLLAAVLLTPEFGRAAEYVSLYGYGQQVSYCSPEPCDGRGNCVADSYPCGGDYPFKYTDTLAGFKDLYNLDDPRILCGRDVEAVGDECAPEEKSLSLGLGTLKQKGLKYISSFPDAFRVFIPAGTVYGYVNIYMPIDALEGVVVRFRQPPDGVYCQYAGQPARYDDVPWDVPNRVTLSTMEKRDVYLRNWGGLAAAVSPFYLGTPLRESGWLYIRKLPFDSGRIHKISVSFRVNVAAYQRWYESTVWDAAGDPWSADNHVAPTRVCSSSRLDACLSASACTRVGAYWYDDKCHANPACTAGNLTACGQEDECRSSGFYWYDGHCNQEAACSESSIDACKTSSECESSGFYWYDGFCNLEPRCRPDNLSGCEDAGDCEGIGAYWYDGECHAVPACSENSLYSCDTEEKCVGSGFYWRNGSCSATSSCSRYNLAGCDNRTECQANGGIWYTTGECRPPATTTTYSSGSTFTPRTTGSSGLTALFGLNGGVTTTTRTITTGSTATTGSSAAVGGGTVTATRGVASLFAAPNAPAVPACDPEHLDLCDREGCASLGGEYWFDGENCRRGKEVVDYNGRINEAFCRLGEDVDDGDLVRGENVAMEMNFNAGDAVHYALILLPNDEFYFIHNDRNRGPIFSREMMPVGDAGVLLEATDICAAAPEYQGKWQILLLTVPGGEGLDDPDKLTAYLQSDDARYLFGSYTVEVNCQEKKSRRITSLFLGSAR